MSVYALPTVKFNEHQDHLFASIRMSSKALQSVNCISIRRRTKASSTMGIDIIQIARSHFRRKQQQKLISAYADDRDEHLQSVFFVAFHGSQPGCVLCG